MHIVNQYLQIPTEGVIVEDGGSAKVGSGGQIPDEQEVLLWWGPHLHQSQLSITTTDQSQLSIATTDQSQLSIATTDR